MNLIFMAQSSVARRKDPTLCWKAENWVDPLTMWQQCRISTNMQVKHEGLKISKFESDRSDIYAVSTESVVREEKVYA